MAPTLRLLSAVLLTSLLQQFANNHLCEANQIPPADLESVASGPPISPAASIAGGPVVAATAAATTSEQLKLPKINIYVNKNEIRKLLGINDQINYVTNGNVNTYPLGFTIPLGYNHSDMIFTWQNLGQTNVNYSISLFLSSLDAVMTPSINITRVGQIPKQEQVFLIKLPCSGKVTAEVDVQVLIDIVGFVYDNKDSSSAEQASQADIGAAAGGQPELLGAGAVAAASASPVDQIQTAKSLQNPRLVSYRLAIKRKKICTQHPVVMAAAIPTAGPRITQSPPLAQPGAWNGGQNRWSKDSTVASTIAGTQTQHQTPSDSDHSNETTGPTKPVNEDTSSAPALPEIAPAVIRGVKPLDHLQTKFAYPNWPAIEQYDRRMVAAPTPGPIPEGNPLNNFIQQERQREDVPSTFGNSNNPLVLSLIALSLLISVALIALVVLGSSNKNPLEKLSTLTSYILRRTPASHHQANNKCKSPITSAVISPFRAGPKSSASSSVSGLSVISGHLKSPFHSAVAGGGPIAMGTATMNGYCYKTTNCAGYYTNSNQYQQHQHHHYQQPPTADLLGTGYQCQPLAAAAAPPPHYPISHIAPSNASQMTRLVWSNGNGKNPDGFSIDQSGSYLPHPNNAPISDNGSIYQTIY